MTPGTQKILLLGLLVLGVWFYEVMRPIPQPPGILAPDAPQATPLANKPRTFVRNEYVFRALARFEAKARILSVERYRHDRESQVALLDMVLGWGRLSDSVTLKNVDIAQNERGVLSKSYDPTLPDAEVEAHILNLHLVASDPEVEKRVKKLRVGNVVRFEGVLVEAKSADGWRWKGQPRAHSPKLEGTLLWIERLELAEPATKS
jgi:hypothetical protein